MQPLSHVHTVENGQGAGLLVHTPTAAIHRTLAQGVCMLAFRRSLEVYYGSETSVMAASLADGQQGTRQGHAVHDAMRLACKRMAPLQIP